MTIYICTPIASGDRTEEDVLSRIEELRVRLKSKGFDSCSHLDNGLASGKWAQQMGANIALILSTDGILLDTGRGNSRVCAVEEAVARTMRTWKKGYLILHSKEEYDYINDNFVV